MTLKICFLLFFFGWLSFANVMGQTLHLQMASNNESENIILKSFAYQKSFSDYNSLEQEIQNFHKSLTRHGYLESELLNLEKPTDSSYVAFFKIGRLYTKVRIYYNAEFNPKQLKLMATNITDTYFEVEVTKLETSLKLLNEELSNSGDPFSTLQLKNIKTDDGTLTAHLKIENTKERRIDSIIVKGYEKFPKSYLKHFLKLRPHQSFNLKTIKKKLGTLEQLHFASQIKDPEVLFTKDSTLLYIYLDKKNSNTFDGFIGFGTNPQTTKLEFDGYLHLNLNNTLNFGEIFRLQYKSDESDQKTLDLKLKLPYLLGSPLGTQLGLTIFKKDSTYITTSQFANLIYQIDTKNSASLGITKLNSTNLLNSSVQHISDYASIFYDINYHHSAFQSNDKLFPINFLIDFSMSLGNRSMERRNETQIKFQLQAFKIFNLNIRNSIYTNISAAILNSEKFLENELFRFGGIHSIRGFEEHSLMANLYTVLNTEYRYKLSTNLYVNSIVDFAYYDNQLINTRTKLFGLGFGFGIRTQAGLFKLNYSNGSVEDQPIKLSDSKIHLSLSATF